VVKQLGGETYYAVVVGNYPTREAAQQALPRVAQYCRCQPVVIELP
jgi:septal ring-binding cell division protein DamX